MSDRIKCSVTTNAGRECQAWAMIGSDPPLCWAHGDRRNRFGMGREGTNASGFYDRQLSQQELADVRALSEDQTLNSELVLNRVFLRRLLVALQESDELDPMQLAKLAPIIFRGTQAVARLLREERALNGDADDGVPQVIGQALDALSKELGLEL